MLAALAVLLPLNLVAASARTRHHVVHATVLAKHKKKHRAHAREAHKLRPIAHAGLLFRISRSTAGRHRATAHRTAAPTAHAAGDPGDTISDFKFTPGTITIHVGDTITWTNAGPSAHTVTDKGVFDTGLLNKGQSASHTFTSAGTFAYICTVHPFMHGTVVVLANATRSGGSGGSSGSSSPPTASTAAATPASTAASGSTLPNTGLNVASAVGVALLLLGLGIALSHRTRATS